MHVPAGYSWRAAQPFSLWRRLVPSQLLTRLPRLATVCAIAGYWVATPIMPSLAAKPQFSPVVQSIPLTFPRDFGAHPSFRNEWWYVTGGGTLTGCFM